jgi:hypothetical protein
MSSFKCHAKGKDQLKLNVFTPPHAHDKHAAPAKTDLRKKK